MTQRRPSTRSYHLQRGNLLRDDERQNIDAHTRTPEVCTHLGLEGRRCHLSSFKKLGRLGCFVFKPASKKRKISSAADYFSKDNNDLEDHGLRFDTCQLLWKQIKCETEQLQEDLNKKLFNDLIQFLRQSHSDFKEKKTEWACRIKSSEIPAAAVVLGVNVTDHDLTFKSLSEILQNDVTPFVVSLRSKECPDIKHLLQKMMIQLMDCHVEVDSSEEEESSKISPSRIHCSVANLTKWYRNITKTTDSTASYKKTSSSRHWESPPVVVIFKDMESFTTKLLLTSQFPFKLSEKVLQVLINLFLYHDFSVQNFIKGFQLSLLEHFYSHPLSVLCCELQEAKKRVKCLSHSQCENIRRLPSFRRFVESQVSDKQTALLTDDDYLKETAQALLQDLHTYHENFYPVLKCLHAVTSSLPKYPLGKQIRELYCACLEKKVWETEEYESAMQLVRMLAKNDLVDVLEKCVAILASCPEKHLGNTSEKLKEYLGRLRNPEAEASDDHEKSISSLKELQKKTDLYHLQKTLLEMKDSRRLKKLTQFEMLRFEVVDFIDSLVKNFLAPAEMQTLHEVMYFSAANTLREHLNAAPRVALHTALNNPYFYLKNESLKSDAGSISNTAPDICIAYKLHLECGRLINLVDWLEAFSTVVTAAENPNSTVKDQMDDVTQAVSELELLGFIKPTKQKTDHVARLTWGSC
ncbi:Origin recognition complex subunit 3 [Varanus komodoensis]|nr:Origin recognition complex subunit 3 [Varanus komodoensis]